mmetsp:Transcript_4930/g.12308  ORF Transcript_4930/g.12308 Transcript_4930/m.12308 type:complete len:269 (+) Transcript_4930:1941-2747(+)
MAEQHRCVEGLRIGYLEAVSEHSAEAKFFVDDFSEVVEYVEIGRAGFSVPPGSADQPSRQPRKRAHGRKQPEVPCEAPELQEREHVRVIVVGFEHLAVAEIHLLRFAHVSEEQVVAAGQGILDYPGRVLLDKNNEVLDVYAEPDRIVLPADVQRGLRRCLAARRIYHRVVPEGARVDAPVFERKSAVVVVFQIVNPVSLVLGAICVEKNAVPMPLACSPAAFILVVHLLARVLVHLVFGAVQRFPNVASFAVGQIVLPLAGVRLVYAP